MRHTILGVIEIPSHQKVNDLDFHGKSSQHSLDRYHNPPLKQKNRMQSSPLHRDDDIRDNFSIYRESQLLHPTHLSDWHPGSGGFQSAPQIKSENTQMPATPSRIPGWKTAPWKCSNQAPTQPIIWRWPHLHLAGPADVRDGWRLVLHADMPCCDLLE